MAKRRPHVPTPPRSEPAGPKVCDKCFETAFAGLAQHGVALAEARRRAGEFARTVSWRGELRCPRCTVIRNPYGKPGYEDEQVTLRELLPTREDRRSDDRAFLRALRKGSRA